MKRLIVAAIAALCLAAPAAGQTITGCASVPTNRVATSTDKAKLAADIACLGRAKVKADAEIGKRTVRLSQIAVPAPKPPAPTVPPVSPPPAPDLSPPAAIPSNFDRLALIGPARMPGTAAPDVVGAFRFICQPSHELRDDPIVWPGQPGKAHLHQFFGNTLANASSTFASLRTTGASTCMNELNRSAYWLPAMLNEAGMVIRPDWASVYYKRLPASSPECKRMAKDGCVPLPNGVVSIAGYDHANPDSAENRKHASWKCLSNAIVRANITDALADCGGQGQIAATVEFPDCWNGATDSPDHRSHLAYMTRDPNSGQEGCDPSHTRIIPKLTQTVAWSIERSDGRIRLSSDHDGDAPGSTLHFDDMTAWDAPTLATATANCMDKLLNCNDGELGDGTIMKRWSGFGYAASPRLVVAPNPQN